MLCDRPLLRNIHPRAIRVRVRSSSVGTARAGGSSPAPTRPGLNSSRSTISRARRAPRVPRSVRTTTTVRRSSGWPSSGTGRAGRSSPRPIPIAFPAGCRVLLHVGRELLRGRRIDDRSSGTGRLVGRAQPDAVFRRRWRPRRDFVHVDYELPGVRQQLQLSRQWWPAVRAVGRNELVDRSRHGPRLPLRRFVFEREVVLRRRFSRRRRDRALERHTLVRRYNRAELGCVCRCVVRE